MIRKTTLAAVLALSAIAATASAQGPKPAQRNTTPYPAQVRANFMPACQKDNVLSEAQCACIHRNLEREYTLAEYIEMDKAAAEGKEHPFLPRMKEIVVACYTNPAY